MPVSTETKDRYLPGVVWAYRNSPHESTQEKPSFLLFGIKHINLVNLATENKN